MNVLRAVENTRGKLDYVMVFGHRTAAYSAGTEQKNNAALPCHLKYRSRRHKLRGGVGVITSLYVLQSRPWGSPPVAKLALAQRQPRINARQSLLVAI